MKYTHDEIIKIHNDRYACKSYRNEKSVSDKDFQTLLEVARLSPSSFGFEPWKMIVVEDEEVKKELYPVCWGAQKSLEGSTRFVIFLARKKKDLLANSDYLTNHIRNVQHGTDESIARRMERFAAFENEDFKLTQSEDGLYHWACHQCYIALANMLTSAAMLGIDSCPIEGFQKENVEKILAKHNIDTDTFSVAVMASFGYRNEDIRPKTRRDLKDIVINL